jgi:hypothetical protein
LGSGQRPSVIRLASGRLFFVADGFTSKSKKPSAKREGSYVALGDDDGANWIRRDLPPEIKTVGYTTATQAPDGVIHIVTSKNKPNFEIELNEKWVQDGGPETPPARTVHATQAYKESYPNGKIRAAWQAGVGEDGTYLLNGTQTFYYEDGNKQWQAHFVAGEKRGVETFWNPQGRKLWERHYAANGEWNWILFDAVGKPQARSEWRGKLLIEAKP